MTKLREKDARQMRILERVRQRVQEHRRYGVVAQHGCDEDRPCVYELRELGVLEAWGVQLRGIWCRQRDLKGERGPQEHFLLTTLPEGTAGAQQVRGLGRFRWHIENNGFRELNQKMGLKHRYTEHGRAAEVLTGLMLVAQPTLQGHVFWKRQKDGRPQNPKVTVGGMMKRLLGSLLKLGPSEGRKEPEPKQLELFSARTLRRLRRSRRVASG